MLPALVILIVLLFFIYKGFSDPFFGLLGLITVFEVQPGELYPVLAPLHPERSLALVVLLSFLAKGGKFVFPPITKRFLWFFGAMVLAVPTSFWMINSVWACIAFLSTVYYHLMLVALLKTVAEVRKVLLLLIGLITWLGASADYQYHAGVRQFQMGIDRAEGMTSSGGDPNTLANSMVLAMPLMWLFMWKGNGKWTRVYALFCFSTALYTVVITGSRTAFLAFVTLMVILVFRKKSNLKFLPVLCLALPLLWIVLPEQYKERYKSVRTREEDQSYTDRLLSWQGGVRMFLHNPVTGVGPDNYTAANGDRYWPETPRVYLNAHSLYFKLLGELGGLGVFTFVAYLVTLLRLNWWLGKRFRLLGADPLLQNFPGYCNVIMYMLLFTGYSGHNLYRVTWYTMGAISGALSLIAVRTEGAEAPAGPVIEARKRPLWLPRREEPSVAALQPAGAEAALRLE